MYIEGLHNEGILRDAEDSDSIPQPSTPPRGPQFGKPEPQGTQNVDLRRVTTRTVQLHSVNWGPPE